MLKTLLFGIGLFLLVTPLKAQRLYFLRGHSIYSSNLEGEQIRKEFNTRDKRFGKAAEDYGFRVSPDGKHFAFTKAAEKTRQIGVFTPEDGTVNILEDTSAENAYDPVWSPDGSHIAFHCWYGNLDKICGWGVGIVDKSLKGFVNLHPNTGTSDLYSMYKNYYNTFSWLSDSSSITCWGDSLFRFTSISRLTSTESIPKFGLDTSKNWLEFSFLPYYFGKDRYLLYGVSTMDEGSSNFQENFDESDYQVLYVYDNVMKMNTRITPINVAVGWGGGVPLPDNQRIVFVAVEAKKPLKKNSNPNPNIYVVNKDGTDLQLLIKNATSLSVSRE